MWVSLDDLRRREESASEDDERCRMDWRRKGKEVGKREGWRTTVGDGDGDGRAAGEI